MESISLFIFYTLLYNNFIDKNYVSSAKDLCTTFCIDEK